MSQTDCIRVPAEDDYIYCIRCGQCVSACPVPYKALRFDRGRKEPPVYHYELCIRCYCCIEVCPHGALQAIETLPGKLLRRITHLND